MSEPQDLVSQLETPDSSVATFYVVVNHEEQYSIWDMRREIPRGWQATGFVGPEAACLEHIDSVWTDMRPLSLRRAHGDD